MNLTSYTGTVPVIGKDQLLVKLRARVYSTRLSDIFNSVVCFKQRQVILPENFLEYVHCLLFALSAVGEVT